jgi:uncharacterized membrane protein
MRSKSGLIIALASVWLIWIVAAPIALYAGHYSLSSLFYATFSMICHQIPERSFYLSGYPLAVCARCTGVYLGFFIGLLSFTIKPIEVAPPRIWFFLALVPTLLDWTFDFVGVLENTHLSRGLTGLLPGFVSVYYILPGLVSLRWNSFKLALSDLIMDIRKTS